MSKKTDAVMLGAYDPILNPSNVANNQAQNQFDDLYRMYVKLLSELCINRFKWEGLPDDIDPRFLEMTLFRGGLSVFYFDDRYLRFLALRGSSAGRWNMYDNPTWFQVSGNAFINRQVSAVDAVPIWANATRSAMTDIVSIYARQLANLSRTIEINTASARRGKVMAIPENMKLSAQNYVNQIDRGDAVIFVNSQAFNPTDGSLTALDLGVDPDTIVNLHILKARLWSECMGVLGIDNSNQDKKERLVQAEVSANDGQTDNMRRVSLNAREYAAQQINDKWGLDVRVSFHVDDAPNEEPDAEDGEPVDTDDNAEQETTSGNDNDGTVAGS